MVLTINDQVNNNIVINTVTHETVQVPTELGIADVN